VTSPASRGQAAPRLLLPPGLAVRAGHCCRPGELGRAVDHYPGSAGTSVTSLEGQVELPYLLMRGSHTDELIPACVELFKKKMRTILLTYSLAKSSAQSNGPS
jgi:hypothetical protein